MDRQHVRAVLAEILSIVQEGKPVAVESIADDVAIREGLGLDSLQMTEVMFEIEEKLNAKIEDAEAMELGTVGDLIDLIVKKTTG